MSQCCYKTHKEDSQTFSKIDINIPIVAWEYEKNIQPISQCYAGYTINIPYHTCIILQYQSLSLGNRHVFMRSYGNYVRGNAYSTPSLHRRHQSWFCSWCTTIDYERHQNNVLVWITDRGCYLWIWAWVRSSVNAAFNYTCKKPSPG